MFSGGISDLCMSPTARPGSPLRGCGHLSDHASVVAFGVLCPPPLLGDRSHGLPFFHIVIETDVRHRATGLFQVVLNSTMTFGSYLRESRLRSRPRVENAPALTQPGFP